nr:ribonuclease H-like domain-containing protein [Tanacetum cinerariifolium]
MNFEVFLMELHAPKRDLRLIDEHIKSVYVDVISSITPNDVKTVKTIDVNHKGVFSIEEPKPVMKNNFSPLIIEDWHSDDESEVEISPTVEVKIVKPSVEKIKSLKTARETVKNEESPKQHKHPPRGNQRNWNNLMSQRLGSNFKMINKACYVCGSFEHLHYVCDKKVLKPMWNNTRRMNHKNFANKFTHPHPKRGFVPQAVLTRSGNKCYLIDNEDYDGRFISFGYGKGRISRKEMVKIEYLEKKIKTRTLDFDDVYFFPRKDNIYSVVLKIVVPTGGLTCLFAKATTDESTLWHRRLGYINYKTMNKLVRGNLMREIKREFSVARTPQQNGVAKRKNKTLIEAARTIPPLIDFMKPFGCPVTILNTKDYLGKFDEKANEGFFVGYSVVCKAMRVFNKRTRIVEETLNIRFLEIAHNVKGNRPDWLFDIDSLTISMNYVPVVAGFQTNGFAGTKDHIVAGQAEKKKELEQDYILIPICTTDPLISQGPKDSVVDAGKKATQVDESQVSDNGGQEFAGFSY